MSKTYCGLDCSECPGKDICKGCTDTDGSPCGGTCVLAMCCMRKKCKDFGKAFEGGYKL